MTHRQWEAKHARRLKHITGPSRASGHVRGPVTRGAERARLMAKGEHRIFAMVASTHGQTAVRAKAKPAPMALVQTSCADLAERLEHARRAA